MQQPKPLAGQCPHVQMRNFALRSLLHFGPQLLFGQHFLQLCIAATGCRGTPSCANSSLSAASDPLLRCVALALPCVSLCMQAYWFVDFYTLDWGREKIEEFLDTCQVPHLAGDFLQFLFHLPRIVYPFFITFKLIGHLVSLQPLHSVASSAPCKPSNLRIRQTSDFWGGLVDTPGVMVDWQVLCSWLAALASLLTCRLDEQVGSS